MRARTLVEYSTYAAVPARLVPLAAAGQGSSNEDTSKSAVYTVTQVPNHSTTLVVLSTFGCLAASQPTRRAITHALAFSRRTFPRHTDPTAEHTTGHTILTIASP